MKKSPSGARSFSGDLSLHPFAFRVFQEFLSSLLGPLKDLVSLVIKDALELSLLTRDPKFILVDVPEQSEFSESHHAERRSASIRTDLCDPDVVSSMIDLTPARRTVFELIVDLALQDPEAILLDLLGELRRKPLRAYFAP